MEDTFYDFTMDKGIKRAKDFLQHKLQQRENESEGRAWLGPLEVTPYNYRVEDEEGIRIWILQGSPCRGMVIANYGCQRVTVLNVNNQVIKHYSRGNWNKESGKRKRDKGYWYKENGKKRGEKDG